MTIRKQDIIITKKMVVDFQDHFKNDNISVKLNNCLILKNKLLDSKKGHGNTEVTLTIDNRNSVFLSEMILKVLCKVDIKPENSINIVLNGDEQTFFVDLSKGIYIGFGKKGNRLYLSQSKVPFEYE